VETDEEIWFTNKTDRKLRVGVKEVFFYYADVALPKETITERIGKHASAGSLINFSKIIAKSFT